MPSSVSGIPELKKALASIGPKLEKKVLRTELRAAAKVMASEVKAQAPVESGKVRSSVKVRAAKRKKGRVAIQVEVTGGHQGDGEKDSSGGNIIGFVEFGRIGQAPNPFIRRSFAAKQAEVRSALLANIARAIESIGKS